jgi:hypothetical protein
LMRIKLKAVGIMDLKTIKKNVRDSKRYERVRWGVFEHKPCAIVGGGPGLKSRLEILRDWDGDIFAINDTARYLSRQGIPCYLYAIDGTEVPFKIGPLVKGAVFASRVNRIQFKQFKRKDVRIFHMADDGEGGIEGGPTAVCRTPHLFLKMGYKAVFFFGCEGCFYDKSHAGDISEATKEAARANMMVVTVGGVDYLTNAALLMQNEYMMGVINKYPQFLINASGGLLEAMIKDPEGWSVTAITDNLKRQYESAGINIWTQDYKLKEDSTWQPQAAL